MASFRDRFNPEAVHFPAKIGSKVLIVCGAAAVLLATLPSYWVEKPLEQTLLDLALSAACILFLFLAWPNNLQTDQFGVSQRSPFPHRCVFIAWKDVASLKVKRSMGGVLSWLGMESESLVVYSLQGKRITHGPRHTDRQRFVHELEIHGVNTRAETGEKTE